MFRLALSRHRGLLLPISITTALAASACAPTKMSTETSPPMTTKEILEGSSLPALLPTALPDDSMGVTIHRLSNGITVYISTDREKPRFSANVPVRTGSRNDPAKSTGLAHYLEHMLFKGTDELGTMDMESERPHIEEVARLYGELRAAEDEAARNVILKKIDEATQESSKFSVPNELSRLYAQLGIEGLNAYTWLDQTVYIADIPANRLAAWAAVEYERFSDPVFRLFYPELEAVYEEKNISLDSPYRRMNQALMASLFPTHPYGTQPTIGLVEHLKTPAYQDMADYFEDWYAPNNMAIVLAGDIDAETAIPVLESTIGQIPARTLGTAEPATVTPMTSRVEQVVEAEGETSIILAWHTVAAGHEDRPAVRILDMLVDNSVSGILNVALTTTQKVARAGSSPSFHKEAGWWEMSATAKEGQTPEELERLLLGVVADLKKGAFTEEDLAAVKLRLELEYQVSLENNYGRVSTMTDAFVEGREWADVVASRARLQEVTREDVLRVANTYLGDAYAVVKRIPGTPTLPKIEKPTISPVELDPSRESEFSERILQIEAPAIEPVWIVEGESYARATSPGASLIAAKNERNQMFTVGYSFDLGSWKQPGICFSLDLAERSGTAEMTNEAIKKRLDRLGSSVGVDCRDHETRFYVTGLDSNMEESLSLVEEWMRGVVIRDDALETAKTTKLGRRKDNLASERFLSRALRAYGQRGEDSAYLHQISDAELNKLTRDEVEVFARELFSHEREVLYFGPRSIDAVKPLLMETEKLRPTERRIASKYRRVEQPTIYFLHRDQAKSNVEILVPRKPGQESERVAANLWSNYLSGGMGGLIFQEIREARGLAYSAGAWVRTGTFPDDEWAISGSLGTQGDKTVEALTLMLELLLKHRFNTEMFEVTKTAMDQEFRADRISPRWVPAWVRGWDRSGFGGDPRPTWREQTKSTSIEELQAWTDELVAGTAPVITVVGNRETVDMEGLAKLGMVIEVQAEDLVSW